MRETLLEIKDLNVEVEGKYILKGLNLTIKKGEIHAIMGPMVEERAHCVIPSWGILNIE